MRRDRCNALWLLVLCFAPVSVAKTGFAQAAQLRISAQTSTFRIGERIPLTLTYSAPLGTDVRLVPLEGHRRDVDRSVEVTPASGWSDPYPARSIGIIGGLMPVPQKLSEKPIVGAIELNEWVRFEQPGDYDITIAAREPFSPFLPAQTSAQSQPTLHSDPIRLHIMPATPEWQASSFANAVTALKAPSQTNTRTDIEQRNAACATIADLGTESAFRFMAANLQDSVAGPFTDRLQIFQRGLTQVSPTQRPAVLKAMSAVLNDPTVSITGTFVNVWISLHTADLPPEQYQHYAEVAADAWRRLVATLSSRSGQSLAESADVLARFQTPDQDAEAMLKPYLVVGFRQLTLQGKLMSLQANWRLLRSAEMLPELQRLARLPYLTHDAENDNESFGRNTAANNQLRVLALRRWYDLDPAEVRAFTVQAIGTEHPTYWDRDLSFLPTEPLPQYESLWATALLQQEPSADGSRLSGLLARFGTGTAVAQVAEYLDVIKERNGCNKYDAAAIAYLVRFAPEQARPRLATWVHDSSSSGCGFLSLLEVARYGSGPPLEEAAIAKLQGDDEPAYDLVQFLQRYGTSAAREPLKKKLDRLLTESPDVVEPHYAERMQADSRSFARLSLLQGLMQALLAPEGWLPTIAEIEEWTSRCHDPETCPSPAGFRAAVEQPTVYVDTLDGERSRFRVSGFPGDTLEESKGKLRQYPAGTSVSCHLPPGVSPEAKQQLQAAVDAAHLSLKQQ